MQIEQEAKDVVLKRLTTGLKFVPAKLPEEHDVYPSSYIVIKLKDEASESSRDGDSAEGPASVVVKEASREPIETSTAKSAPVDLTELINSYSQTGKTNGSKSRKKSKKNKNSEIS